MRDHSALGRILATCVAEHDWQQAPFDAPLTVDLSALPRLARYHGVSGCVYQSLRNVPEIDPTVLETLRADHRLALVQCMRVLADLRDIKAVLDESQVEWLVLKGPVLSEVVYRRSDLRQYRDLDLLVPRLALPDVVEALKTHGFPVLDRNWRAMRREMRGQLHVRLRHGTVGDVHWHLVNRDRTAFTISMAPVLSRARVVAIQGMHVRTLDPLDTLVHTAVHACLAGGDRLTWLKDIEQIVSWHRPDWQQVIERAREWNVAPLVATMLRRSTYTLSLPVPRPVVRALSQQRSRRSVDAVANLLSPPERSTGSPSMSRLLASTTRAEIGDTARALRRHALARLSRAEGQTTVRPDLDEDASIAFLDAVVANDDLPEA